MSYRIVGNSIQFLKNRGSLDPSIATAVWRIDPRHDWNFGLSSEVFIRFDRLLLPKGIESVPSLLAHEEGHIELRHLFHHHSLNHKLEETEADIYAVSKVGFEQLVHDHVALNKQIYEIYGELIYLRAMDKGYVELASCYRSLDDCLKAVKQGIDMRLSAIQRMANGIDQSNCKDYINCLLAEMR